MNTLNVDRFGSITLDELVSEAGLMTRVDRKYIVPASDLATVLGELPDETLALNIDGTRNFAYESVYFDTPDLLSFMMAAHPRRRRFKVRTRSYVDTGGTFLEIKTRGARGTTVKDRVPYDEVAALTDDALESVGEALSAINVDEARSEELTATLTTKYQRATLLAPDHISRTTIDTNLIWQRPDGSGLALPTMAIVETKSPSSASMVDRLLWRHGHRPAAISKYATGLAACTPGIPRNKWARVLRGPFAQAVAFNGSEPTGSVATGSVAFAPSPLPSAQLRRAHHS